MKKLTWVFTLYPVSIYGQDHEKQNWTGTNYQSLFELQKMLRKIPFWFDPLNLETVEKKGKKRQNISRTKRAFYRK